MKVSKPKRIWTARHYRPILVGSIVAGVYAGGLRWACWYLGFPDPPAPVVAVVGQAMLWLGVWCARMMWFD